MTEIVTILLVCTRIQIVAIMIHMNEDLLQYANGNKPRTQEEKEAIINTTFRDMSKLLQSKSSYGTSTKIAGDIQKGFGQSFSKESSGQEHRFLGHASEEWRRCLHEEANPPIHPEAIDPEDDLVFQ